MTRKDILCIAILFSALLFPPVAQACTYDAEEAAKHSENAFFKGLVKIVSVEHLSKEHGKPRITYEVVRPEKETENFKELTIVAEGGLLSSCEYGGPWVVGSTVYEEFFLEDGKVHASTINMRALNMEKFKQ